MKKILGWLHLWLGILSGMVVLIVALTGSLLVFEEELEHTFHSSFFYVAAPGNIPRLPLDQLVTIVKAQYDGYKTANLKIEPESDRSVIFLLQKSKTNQLYVAVNPYTGHIIEALPASKRFFTIVLHLHRYLCMGAVGKVITGISCSIFAFLILSGLILWWPKRNNRKQRFRVKWNASFKRLNWDLHAVFGFYIHLVLLVISLTGLVWSYQWVNGLLFYTFNGTFKVEKVTAPSSIAQQGSGYFEKVFRATNETLPYKGPVTITYGNDSLAIAAFKDNIAAETANTYDFLYFEAGTGRLLKTRLHKDESAGMKARRLVYPIHTGSIYGWPTKIIALISTLVAASLPVTGVFIYLGRKKKKPVAVRKKRVLA
ncbi:PepSY-associated TM helix domain-containing protein [Chitinophaga sancti]|uniref:PepSY-associated TM helix domain-containing protein n=1 Tax=Chitinophaga sancti TaxID=1004 RepID=A0A1K1RA57_9BACT|nr:PepSY-associated TM helix domain-containing protein [Chitinophaga sancti]WQD65547.1 PepSY-associated TM helix domain-containing protein [Chitinophaga sancti]WQG88830.1 PepSY-associated TM helix domain-containing protein [Chitinophaga sancti]SFW69122.1 Uncharacterized iron-regulated membrane protein [Chitinophaga sancti]